MLSSNRKSSISFGSDNHSGVHPQILQALIENNSGYAPSYEMDEVSQDLKKYIRKTFGCHNSHIVFNGTAANVLALGAGLRSHHGVLCTDVSHLNVDECGAPEKFIGCKIFSVPHRQGKLSVKDIEANWIRRGDQHYSQLKAVSITQPTEYGTVYSMEEMTAVRDYCREKKLIFHIDGARLANAAVALNCDLKDIIPLADVVSFGGTKNGLLGGEIVMMNSPELDEDFKFLRKQACQLPSKTRFIASQFLAYFQNDLWKTIASHQCQMATLLSQQLRDVPQVTITQPVQSNAVFCILPKKVIKPLKEEYFFYVWDERTLECRLMTSFETKEQDVISFVKRIKSLVSE